MLRLVRCAAILFVFLGVFIVFLYSPFYSKLVIKALNQFVPVEVNPVAASSQKRGVLSASETLEPGSELWIARQAYLAVMKQQMQSNNSHTLTLVHARYKALQQKIQQQQQAKAQISQDFPPFATEYEASVPENNPHYRFDLKNSAQHALMQQYRDFLSTHPIDIEQTPVDEEIFQDIALIHQQNAQLTQTDEEPYAIVVLGGGLTLAENGKDIVVNDYTRLRLETTLGMAKQYPMLPIVLSGVEAPYMQRWLKLRGLDAQLLENRSMNTCENSRFSSLLLQKKGGAPRVILITDAYHMPRTRRLFALNGIHTVAIEAPMPTELTQWQPSVQNYDHSRRANYEMLATLRDVLLGSSDCREVP